MDGPLRVAQVLPGMRRAGAESVVATLCRGLAAAGAETHLVVIGNRFEYREELAGSGVRVHLLDLYQGTVRFYRPDRVWRIRRRLAAFFAGLRPDIAHFHLYHGLVWGGAAARRAGAGVLFTAHGSSPFFNGSDWRSRWLRWGFRRAVARSECRLLAVSAEAAGLLARALDRDAASVGVQSNPIDLDRWRGGMPAPDAQPPRRVIQVGTLYPLKRPEVAIRAVERLPGCALWLVGEGPERVRLEKPASERVCFLGGRADVPALLGRAGAAWLLSEREGQPMAALEAMAAGVPLVATDVPGTRELVRDGENGLLVPLDDPEAVARVTGRLFDEPALRRRLVAGGLETADRHGVARIVAQHLARYREMQHG